MKPTLLIALTLLSSLLGGCASVEKAAAQRDKLETEPLPQAIADLGYQVGAPVQQVVDWNLYNWQAVDQHAVIIWVDAFHPYLFTLRQDCPALEFAQTIGVSSTASIVTDLDSIVVPNPPGGGESCWIDKIYPLKKAAAAQ
ncbi:MAG: hypothetical protein H6987_19050 [Pseudomonadales bacterium]|nr:hypothetical protein [Pseudomonadales bacterium]